MPKQTYKAKAENTELAHSATFIALVGNLVTNDSRGMAIFVGRWMFSLWAASEGDKLRLSSYRYSSLSYHF